MNLGNRVGAPLDTCSPNFETQVSNPRAEDITQKSAKKRLFANPILTSFIKNKMVFGEFTF